MGRTEKDALRERRRGYLQKAVLAAVGITGILLITMIAPNALQLLGAFGKGKKRFNEQAKSALTRLTRGGYIVFEESRGKRFARITEAGRRALAMEEQRMQLAKKPRWDKRFRIVMFDIREERKKTRNRLATTMRSWGFIRLQDSVWVYPYDCEDLVALFKADLKIGKEVVYVIAEKIENDTWIRNHFGLKS